MKIGTAIIIFFLAIIAILAEFFLYMLFGLGALFSGNSSSLMGTVSFFGTLVILTIATAILAPICAIIEFLALKFMNLSSILKHKKESKIKDLFLKDIGTSLLMIFLILILFMVIGVSFGMREVAKVELTKDFYRINSSNGIGDLPITEKESIPDIQERTINTKQAYLEKYVVLESVKVGEGYGRYDTPGYDAKKPTVEGKIRNTGNKSLSRVEITVYFLNSIGQRISEKNYPVIIASSFMADSAPLKPNYVRDFGYIVNEDAPSEWVKKVEIVIADIVFEEK